MSRHTKSHRFCIAAAGPWAAARAVPDKLNQESPQTITAIRAALARLNAERTCALDDAQWEEARISFMPSSIVTRQARSRRQKEEGRREKAESRKREAGPRQMLTEALSKGRVSRGEGRQFVPSTLDTRPLRPDTFEPRPKANPRCLQAQPARARVQACCCSQ